MSENGGMRLRRAQRPTPNIQGELRFGSGFNPWTLDVGRWVLGVEKNSPPCGSISRAFDAIAQSKTVDPHGREG